MRCVGEESGASILAVVVVLFFLSLGRKRSVWLAAFLYRSRAVGREIEIRLSWSVYAAGGDDYSKIKLDRGDARIDLIVRRPTKLVV